MLRAAAVALLALLPLGAAAAGVTVRAVLDEPRIRVGDSTNLLVVIEGAENAPAPEVPNAGDLPIRYVGPSTQISIVNGRTNASVTHHFSVTGIRPGSFTIGPISVTHEGKRYDAGTVTLVVEGVAGGAQREAARPAAEGLRLTLTAPRTQVYVRERLPLQVTLAIGATRVADVQYPTIPGDGFTLERWAEPQQHREQTAGGAVQLVDFRTVLTPLKSGTLSVGPAAMTLNVLVRSRSSDPFFGQLFGDARRTTQVTSEPLVLTVLPLPEADRPADFSGAVGRFSLEVKAAPLELAAGDPVTVTSTIRGEGSLDGITPPAFAASDTLRVYPVQVASGANPGEQVFEQVVIPQQAGAVTLPALRLSYFDPEARAYRTLAHEPIVLNVRPSATARAAPEIVGARPVAPRSEALGRDIVFLKDTPGTLRPIGARRFRSPAFWALQLVPLAVWAAAVAWDRRRRRLTGDLRYARFTRAGRTARRAIAGARAVLARGDHAAFYDTLARAVADYLAAKLDLPPGAVSAEGVGERLRGSGLPDDVLQDLRTFFAACERARFAPGGDGTGDGEATLARADAIVRTLERDRRLGRPIAALALLALVGLMATAWAAAVDSPNTLFFRGNALYAEERFPEAAAEYERVLAAGLESASLHFNLGNARFKAGDVGGAILAYERARRLAPEDPDVQANLGYAREAAGLEPEEPSLWARLLVPLAERMSSDRLLLWASGAWTALFLLLALARLVPASERLAARAALAAGVVLAVVAGSAAWRIATVDVPRSAVVVAGGDTTVRFEPSAGGTAHYQAKCGTVLRVLAEREGWAQVARGDGRRGWVERAAIAEL